MAHQPDERTSPSLRVVGQPPDRVAAAVSDPAAAARRPLLLATKLRIPPAYHTVIPRARLRDQLDQGLRRTVTVIAAPAGFGKTTLLGDWGRQTGRPTAWVSLDEGDNDPTCWSS